MTHGKNVLLFFAQSRTRTHGKQQKRERNKFMFNNDHLSDVKFVVQKANGEIELFAAVNQSLGNMLI